MKIESISEALKQKAQNLSLNVAPIAAPAAQVQPAPTVTQPKQDQAAQQEPAVVIHMNKTPAASVPLEPVVETKQPRKPATTRGTKGKGKSSSLSDIETIVAHHLKAGIDYTTLPRCGNKPVLLKGGAEHLASILGLRTTSEVIHREIILERGFALYEVSTTVYDANGTILAVGLGSCNTHENKYAKQGMANSINTILKIARKRSYVDSILSATGSSRIFTQDIEELSAMEAVHREGNETK